MSDRGVVRLEGVSRWFEEGGRRRIVLDEASAQVDRGEVVVLLGRSGSGKSTVLNLISGIDLPDGGEIQVGDLQIHSASETERTLYRRREIGFVFQSFNLVPTLTVGENVELPLALAKVDSAERGERTRAALADVGLEDRQHAFGDNLSGGERQRVAVARALIHEPSLVLADEPTGNLDIANAEQVLDLLMKMRSRLGATLIIATHSLDAARNADRVLRAREGKLISERVETL